MRLNQSTDTAQFACWGSELVHIPNIQTRFGNRLETGSKNRKKNGRKVSDFGKRFVYSGWRAALSLISKKPEFRIRLNGTHISNINVQRRLDGEEMELVAKDETLGWFGVDDNRGVHRALSHFVLEYRDETAWALLPPEMKRASVDKGWNRCTPQELIGILWNTGVLE